MDYDEDDHDGMQIGGVMHEGDGRSSDRWTRFIVEHHNRSLGKTSIKKFVFGGTFNQPQVQNLEIRTDDGNAMQLALTLTPPKTTNGFGAVIPDDLQNFTGPFYANNDTVNGGPDVAVRYSNPIAHIEWGIGGTESQADADILNGLVVNLTASFVRVRMNVEEVNEDTGTTFYQLAAFVGPGRPKTNNLQRTVVVNQWTAGLSLVQPLPFFAKQVTVIGPDFGGAAFDRVMHLYRGTDGAGGPLLPLADLHFPAATAPQRLAIPNGAMFFQIEAAHSLPASCIFELAI